MEVSAKPTFQNLFTVFRRQDYILKFCLPETAMKPKNAAGDRNIQCDGAKNIRENMWNMIKHIGKQLFQRAHCVM